MPLGFVILLHLQTSNLVVMWVFPRLTKLCYPCLTGNGLIWILCSFTLWENLVLFIGPYYNSNFPHKHTRISKTSNTKLLNSISVPLHYWDMLVCMFTNLDLNQSQSKYFAKVTTPHSNQELGSHIPYTIKPCSHDSL